MRNKFPGICECGTPVDPGHGTVRRTSDGRWAISCAACDPTQVDGPHVPARAFDSFYFWPNGEGVTECTKEYSDACLDLENARRELQEVPEGAPGHRAAYERFHALSDKVNQMLGDGHVGERVALSRA